MFAQHEVSAQSGIFSSIWLLPIQVQHGFWQKLASIHHGSVFKWGLCPAWICVQIGLMPNMAFCPNGTLNPIRDFDQLVAFAEPGLCTAVGFFFQHGALHNMRLLSVMGLVQMRLIRHTVQQVTSTQPYTHIGIHPIWGFVDQVVLCSRGLCLTWIFVQMELMPKMGLLSNQGFWPATGFCPTRSYHTTQGFMEQGLPNGSLPKWDLWPT